MRSPQPAEDLVQDVLVKVHARWPRIETLENPDAYVRRMVINEHLSWRRRLAQSLRRAAAVDPLVTEPVVSFDQRWADRTELVAEILKLPPRQRAVIVLRYFEDLSIEQAARTLGCAESKVRAHTARALATLRVGLVESPLPPHPISRPALPKDHHAH